MRICLIILLLGLAPALVSCSGGNPAVPDSPGLTKAMERSTGESSRWVWGNWRMYIPEDQSSIEAVPVRSADLHYNVKILLEKKPCDNCLWVSKFVNNSDGTVSIDISIRHPFPANRYYTGFDVPGILHTTTHYRIENPFEYDPNAYHFPVVETGDPELLNPDAYTYWQDYSPWAFPVPWEGPIFKYQPGGDLGGTFDEDDKEEDGWNEYWPFINYYSSEVRRHFATNETVTRTYHIALPPGEWEFGYTVDACWAPPINVPVTDIETDFPMQANTLFAYRMDAFISGPLIGLEPSTLTCRVYNHFPELLEFYESGITAFYTNCINGYWHYADEGPTIVDDEYVEFKYELVNELCRPPGRYPILFFCGMSNPGDHYCKQIEEDYLRNARIGQIIWVTVES